MRPRSALVAALLLSVALPASGQFEVPTDVRLPYVLDTGWLPNGGSEAQVISAFSVHVDGATSLRLYFDEVALAGPGAHVRLTSLLDGALQTLDARQVQQWQQSSAYFNGDTVLVELVAGPGPGRSRLLLDSVDAGAPPPGDSQCGPTDDRVPSNDPRVARLLPVGCTSWLIDDCAHCFLTAGHCGTSTGSIGVCEFNVPFSTPSGALVHPGPEDQYAVDGASIQSNGGGGVGNDWAYFGCFANTQTGLTAGEAQGAWFEVVAPPPVSGATIRITGHGTDSSPDSTYNQIQQTHAGPFWSHVGTSLQYQADTTGGNSGSPVIWDNADKAIGIHTHAGCSSSSGNQGTSSQLAALQAALADPKGVCDSACGWTNLGNGLEGVFGEPLLTPLGSPDAGTQLRLVASALPFFSTTNLVIGLSAAYTPFKGGVMVPAPDTVVGGISATSGTAIFGFTFPPGIPSGTIAVFQYWTADAAAVQGWSATNALQLTVP